MGSHSESDEWQKFIELCTKIKSKDTLKEFFDLFLTIEEREVLTSRFRIIKALLDKELTQREIAEKNKVSISQITRGSNAMKVISSELRQFLTKET